MQPPRAMSRRISMFRTKMCADLRCADRLCDYAHHQRELRCMFYWGHQGCRNARDCRFQHER
jgi:hypothetical protein